MSESRILVLQEPPRESQVARRLLEPGSILQSIRHRWTLFTEPIFSSAVAHPRAATFWICCLVVAAVSVHDTIMIVINHEIINQVEQNPIGLWLLQLQGGEVWLFVLVKLAASALVGTMLISINQKFHKIGLTCAVALASFQTVLFGYLTFA